MNVTCVQIIVVTSWKLERTGSAATSQVKQATHCPVCGSVGVTMSPLIVSLLDIFVVLMQTVTGSWSQGLFRSNLHLGPVVMRNTPSRLFLPPDSGMLVFPPQAD